MKKILILGGNRYNTCGIRSIQDAGFFTIVADKNPSAPGLHEADVGLAIDLFDYNSILNALDQYNSIDGIISMAEAGVRPAAYLSKKLGLPSINENSAAIATSKAKMRECWEKCPQYSVSYKVVTNEKSALEAAEQLKFPLIFKPDRSFGGSRGVKRIDHLVEVTDAFNFSMDCGLSGSAVVVENFADGVECSAEVLIWKGKTSVLCVGKKVKSPYPYRVDLSVQYPADFTDDQEKKIEDMCHKSIMAIGLTQGVAHIEFTYTDEGPILLELGARCGGGHTPQIAHHVSGVNELIEYCRMACGLEPGQFYPTEKKGADYRFLVFQPGTVKEVLISDEIRSHKNILDMDITVLPSENIKPLRSTSDRAGFLVALSSDRNQAVSLADWACKKIFIIYENDVKLSANLL